jgi:hypothetical protein
VAEVCDSECRHEDTTSFKSPMRFSAWVGRLHDVIDVADLKQDTRLMACLMADCVQLTCVLSGTADTRVITPPSQATSSRQRRRLAMGGGGGEEEGDNNGLMLSLPCYHLNLHCSVIVSKEFFAHKIKKFYIFLRFYD